MYRGLVIDIISNLSIIKGNTFNEEENNMYDKFIESIKLEFMSQIEEIISNTKSSSEKDELNAIDTLVLINENINSWISSINQTFRIDDELLTKIAELKKPFVSAAKKEVAREVAKIIENESTDITSKINNFMQTIKKKGIDLDGKNRDAKNAMRTSGSTKSNKRKVLTNDVIISENPSRRNYSSCGGGGCSGGC